MSAAGSAASQPVYRWRVVDIVIAAVLGVVSGVVFWAWALPWQGGLSAVLGVTPGLQGLLNGGWLFAGPLGALVVRKPGAAIFASTVGGAVELLLGDSWGFANFIYGVLQGLGAELVFALLVYRYWNIAAVALAGAGAGVLDAILDLSLYYAGSGSGFSATYFVTTVVSGAVAAAVFWFVVRALAATGALDRFPAGRGGRIIDDVARDGDAA
ncbi:ECF transporter S component [Gryllotalpicola sp.]|uniref:ECF transporter S component n=1 Tax=Gryllotalpicola sp. TaxID=1932787 RepID=UPI0026120299|nr:ECF transporter S component [Gryllotalpicola sp.]